MRRSLLLVFVLLSFVFVNPIEAQDEIVFTIYITDEQLAIYVSGNQPIDLSGIGFEFVNSSGDVKTQYLDEYIEFKGELASLQPPLCIVLRLFSTQEPIPAQCATLDADLKPNDLAGDFDVF